MFGSGLRGEKTVEGVWIGGGGVAVIQTFLLPVRVFDVFHSKSNGSLVKFESTRTESVTAP